jgi:arginase family enzyme
MNNCAIAHGTTFRRALEDGCLDPRRVVQIGMRGSGHSLEDYAWPISQVAARNEFYKMNGNCWHEAVKKCSPASKFYMQIAEATVKALSERKQPFARSHRTV